MPEMNTLTVNGVKYDIRDSKALPMTGGTMEGDFNINGHVIWGLGNPTGYDQPVPYRMFVDELANKAPAGYGLGAGGVHNSAVDTIFNGGFYRWDTSNEQTPFAYGTLLVVPREKNSSATQLAFGNAGTSKGVMACRTTTTSAVGEWSFINPLMKVNTDYLTTEFWNSKPVYVKLLNLGSMPSSSTKQVDTSLAVGTYQIIDSSLALINAGGDYIRTRTKDTMDYFFDGTVSGKDNWQATVITTAYYADYTGYLLIKYVEK